MLAEEQVESSYRIFPGIYLLGGLESGVTVYKQQVRAHNLTWSLDRLVTSGHVKMPERIAVVGGGIGALTTAAALLLLFRTSRICIFERQSDLCPLQQGCDTRWIHPHIYDWPAPGSRAPSASIPILNWREGRASDVAHKILNSFGAICDEKDPDNQRLEVILDAKHLRINTVEKSIEWVGKTTTRNAGFFSTASTAGDNDIFDWIIVATGFGRESSSEEASSLLYWQNDTFGQPDLYDHRKTYVISGAGDGALVDLARLTIERFRQDRIVYELFSSDLEKVENMLAPAVQQGDWLALLNQIEPTVLHDAKSALMKRIRQDTRVIMSIAGRKKNITSFSQSLSTKTSFLNKTLYFLLYRCGAFVPCFDGLSETNRRYRPEARHVIQRHGPDSLGSILALFDETDLLRPRLAEILAAQAQSPTPLWPTGYFPLH